MEYFIELSDPANIEREVNNKIVYHDLITQNLTDAEKTVICLNVSTEYSQQSISDITGLSHTTLWNINKSALNKLRDALTEENII